MCKKFILILTIAIVGCNAFQKLTEEEEIKAFNEYATKHKLRFGRAKDASDKAYNTFIENFYEVIEHNEKFEAGNATFRMDLNEFSHIPYDEFIEKYTGYIPPPKRPALDEFEEGSGSDEFNIVFESSEEDEVQSRRRRNTIPDSWNWLEYGMVTPVQSQGSCSVCWAFAALAAVESRMLIKFGINSTLSVQEVINCPYQSSFSGCAGSWGFVAYKHAMNYRGVASASQMPYTGTAVNSCSATNSRVYASNIKSYYATNYYSPTNEELIKQWVYFDGPVYMTYHVSSDFSKYSSGVYTDTYGYCKTDSLNNHAVLIVGYGTENGVDYWLVKNSWGATWGDSGYFKIKRGSNLCGVARDISYPIW